jgi:hypothetical protein
VNTPDRDLILPARPFTVVDEPPSAWTTTLDRLGRRRRRRRLAAVVVSVVAVVATSGLVAVADRTPPAPTEVATRIDVGPRVSISGLPEGWAVEDRSDRDPDASGPVQRRSSRLGLRTGSDVRVNLSVDELGEGGRFAADWNQLPANVTRVEVRGHPAQRTDQLFQIPINGSATRSVHYNWNEHPTLNLAVSAIDETGASSQQDLERTAFDLMERLEVTPPGDPRPRSGPSTFDRSVGAQEVGGPSGPLPDTMTVPLVAAAVHDRTEIQLAFFFSRLLGDGREVGCLALLDATGPTRTCHDRVEVGRELLGTVSPSPVGADAPDVVWGLAPSGTAVVEVTLGADTQEFTAFRHSSLPNAGVFWIAQRPGALAASQTTSGLTITAYDRVGTMLATRVLRPR